MAPAQTSLLAKLDTQERVRDFLTNAVASGRASHAYLFLGAPGAGKLDAAWALAQAFLCEQDGCGACDSCVRVARHTHPDVHYFTPESATVYLIAQTRELLDDVIVESRQAIEMTSIYRDDIKGTRELFSSILDNRLNNAMKYLTSITLLMAVPTVISGLYGMNVQSDGMPFANTPAGFANVLGLTLALCVFAAWVLHKKHML